MQKCGTKILFTSIFGLSFLFSFFNIAIAEVTYVNLAPIPNQNNLTEKEMTINENTLQAYFKNLYRLGIVLATGLAVLMVMWGGIEYITTDAMGGKEEAKERISSAIMGLLLALGSFVILRTIDPNLVSVKLTIEQVDLSKVEDNVGEFSLPKMVQAQYSSVYSQWTEADQVALEAGDATALNKWKNTQSQINMLNKTYKTPASGFSDNVGPANQKVLAQIRAGDCSSGIHCFAGADALYTNAGVTRSTAVFTNSGYMVDGVNPRVYGTPRMPVPGEMVDVITRPGNSTPFHTVIVESIRADGSYVVWDWRHNIATGLRTMNLQLNNPGTMGYIGRVYTPQ